MYWLRNDVISGMFFLVFAILMHLLIIPSQVESISDGPIALSPSLFCHITAFLLLILSLSLVVSGLKHREIKEQRDLKVLRSIVTRGTIAVVFSALYIVFIGVLGYFVSTVLFMIFFLFFSGVRSWQGTLVFLVIIVPFVYLLFVKALRVVLPSGLIL